MNASKGPKMNHDPETVGSLPTEQAQSINFAGAVAVVTGAGSGIGRSLVEALAQRDLRNIVAVDRNGLAVKQTAERANGLFGQRVIAKTLDVTDENAVGALVEEIEEDIGQIGFWFSNAGINCGSGLGSIADWRSAVDVNLLAHVHAARYVLPRMERRQAGSFVLTGSAAGLLSDVRNASYTATKHALVGFAEWLAIGIGRGVNISCMCPEGVLTGMTKDDSKSAGPGINFMEAGEVAEHTLGAVSRGEFLVLTHPRTAEYEARRIQDREGWIKSMRKARARSLGLACLFSA
jgi:NAD(P)-dependent dehydrogenase (short-subunit alcohol dehydrogenase family)